MTAAWGGMYQWEEVVVALSGWVIILTGELLQFQFNKHRRIMLYNSHYAQVCGARIFCSLLTVDSCDCLMKKNDD